MTFQATVYRVLIASPSDVMPQRQIIRETLNNCNNIFGASMKIMFLPVMWEKDAVPEFAGRAQEAINRQLAQHADMLIGTFWARFGTPTEEAGSGTEEEILQFVASDRIVMLYFSTADVNPRTTDMKEFERVESFRKKIQPQAIYGEYKSDQELRETLTRDLSRVVQRLSEKHGTDGKDGYPPGGPETLIVDSTQAEALLIRGEFIAYLDELELSWITAKSNDEANLTNEVEVTGLQTYDLISNSETSFHDFARRMQGQAEPIATQAISALGNRAWEITNAMKYRRGPVAKDGDIMKGYWAENIGFIERLRAVRGIVSRSKISAH